MSESPKHNPTPSGQAPKPKGILKNPLDRRPSQGAQDNSPPDTAPLSVGSAGANGPTHPNGLSWDESNIALHDFEKESTQRMKIDEPKTPFVRGAGGDDEGFDGGYQLAAHHLYPRGKGLSKQQRAQTDAHVPGDCLLLVSSTAFNLDQSPSASTARVAEQPSDKDRAAAELAANTSANASIGGASRPPHTTSAVGLDAADLAIGSAASHASGSGIAPGASGSAALAVDDGSGVARGNRQAGGRTQSRSPSFSLPSSGGSSRRASSRSFAGGSGAAADDSRNEIRQEKMDVDVNGDNDEAVDGVDDETLEEEDAETRAQREAFAKKRNAHYGNEAEALRVAQALAQQEDDEEDEDGQ
ncbi:unnamed protein product [Parajaminaea phylloscopi]